MSDFRHFTRQPHSRASGRSAEQAAVAWLEEHGYRIEARNHATRVGEIDIVARDGEILCFIEIKARRTARFDSPLAAIGWRKQRRIGHAAVLYLAASGWRGPCRFDVLGLTGSEDGWRFELVRDAFELP